MALSEPSYEHTAELLIVPDRVVVKTWGSDGKRNEPATFVPQGSLNEAYAERNAVVLAFARLAVMVGWRVGVLLDEAEPGWPVLAIDTHQGQVTWHMKRDEIPEGEFDVYPDPWDGHDTPEKYARLARLGEEPHV